MTSCQCTGIEHEFNRKVAAKDLRRYRRRGLSRTSRMLVEALKNEGVSDASLIDIGGGIGSVQLALLEAGVRAVTSVDASTAYLETAREAARERGVRARITYIHGNFIEVAGRLDGADVVTLDRVICCFDDMSGLVGASCEQARRLYGLVYPRDRWMTHIGIAAANIYLKIRRSPMRTFIHATELVEAEIRARGFRRAFHGTTPLWQVVVYKRD